MDNPTHLFIPGTKIKPPDAGKGNHLGAHRARFKGDIEVTSSQPFASHNLTPFSNYQHFGVGAGVFQLQHPVAFGGNNFFCFAIHQNRPDRNLTAVSGRFSRQEGLVHKIFKGCIHLLNPQKNPIAGRGRLLYVGEMETSQNKERIAKVLARAGVASRREVERMIADGRITLKDKPVTSPATFIAGTEGIKVDGKAIARSEKTRLWMYHKPKGLVTTHNDPGGRPTVFENLPKDIPRVISVGRLDINTEGVLLLTNDGGLARLLELPSSGIKRKYRVRVHGIVKEEGLNKLADGVTVGGINYGQIIAKLEKVQGSNAWIALVLTEGKNREVKNVLGHLGLRVTRLIRTQFGPFSLRKSKPNEIIEISSKQIQKLWRP